jgi:hypothetical protein
MLVVATIRGVEMMKPIAGPQATSAVAQLLFAKGQLE